MGIKEAGMRAVKRSNERTAEIPSPRAERLSEARDEATDGCGREKFHWEKLYYFCL